MESHVGVMRDANDNWDIEDAKANAAGHQFRFQCHWARCQHLNATDGTEDLFALGQHMKTHLPDANDEAAARRQSNKRQKLNPRTGRPTA